MTFAHPLAITPATGGGGTVLVLEGDLRHDTSLDFEWALHIAERERGDERITLDLSGVRFVDGAGLRALASARRRARRHGRLLEVIRPRGEAGRIFDLIVL